jgi:hypothetical protein
MSLPPGRVTVPGGGPAYCIFQCDFAVQAKVLLRFAGTGDILLRLGPGNMPLCDPDGCLRTQGGGHGVRQLQDADGLVGPNVADLV